MTRAAPPPMGEDGYGTTAAQFREGTAVELHPGCDRWMMGDRFGWVTRTNQAGQVFVRLAVSGKVLPFSPDRLRYRTN